jgi:hypothetical protein
MAHVQIGGEVADWYWTADLVLSLFLVHGIEQGLMELLNC